MPQSKSAKSVNRGLGKGFDALLPHDFDTNLLVNEGDRIQHLQLGEIVVSSGQPRHHFDDQALQQLAESIKQYGILQPLVATPAQAGKYMLIAGERRWRAARLAGLKTVPVILRSAQELERLELALVENVQRVDLSLLEQAASIERLHQQFNLTYDVIGRRLGKADSTISNIARLLQLPPDAQRALHEKRIVEAHARAILSLKDSPEAQAELLRSIIKGNWTVRQAEHFAVTFKRGTQDRQTVRQKMRSETPATKRLGQYLQAPVNIWHTAHGGRLEIGFTSEDDLDRLLQTLLGR